MINLWLTLLLLPCSSMCFAQYYKSVQNIRWSLKFEPGLTFLENARFVKKRVKITVSGGVGVLYYISNTVGVEGSVVYKSRGGNYEKRYFGTGGIETFVTYEQGLGYISIPLNTNFYLSDRRETEKFYFKLGINPEYLINSKLRIKNKDDIPIEETKGTNIDKFNRFNFGLVTGFGIQYGKLTAAEINYFIGITDISKDSSVSKTTTHGPQVSLKLLF